MITPMRPPARSTTRVLVWPTSPATADGKPKIPLPTMQLTASATMLQRLMARTNCGDGGTGGALIGLLYHKPAPPPVSGIQGELPRALFLRDAPRVQRDRGAT